jgi:class 3 adenylate cyclase
VSETRKLAAILVADIVGYSRLTSADEDRTLARVRGLRSDLIDPAIAAHHGRIVKRTGDGAIIEFRSVVDAVRCAIEVQNGLIERNAGVPEDRRIEYRVGIHVGDVVEESDGDLMGDGVNVAARLEGICEPGGVCLSEDAYRQVKSRLELQVADLGPRSLKNIAEPVHAYLLRHGAPATQKSPQAATRTRDVLHRWPALAAALALALLAVGAFAWRAGYAPRFMAASVDDKLDNAPRLSIVVLPLENLSGDKEQDYFADGITEDLTTTCRTCRTASSSRAARPSPTRASPSTPSRSARTSACAMSWRVACGGWARRSPSTLNSSRRRPALMSGQTALRATAASSASFRSRPYPVLPIRLASSSRQGRSLARDAGASEQSRRRRPRDARMGGP